MHVCILAKTNIKTIRKKRRTHDRSTRTVVTCSRHVKGPCGWLLGHLPLPCRSATMHPKNKQLTNNNNRDSIITKSLLFQLFINVYFNTNLYFTRKRINKKPSYR